MKSLTLDISGRNDFYSDFGDAKTYKIGLHWMPFEESEHPRQQGRTFDAPSLADVCPRAWNAATPIPCSAPRPNVPVGTSAADAVPSISVPGGNPNLGPEVANTNSIGVDFTPGDYGFADFTGLDLSVTSWHIFIEHQIGPARFGERRGWLAVHASVLFAILHHQPDHRADPGQIRLQHRGRLPGQSLGLIR